MRKTRESLEKLIFDNLPFGTNTDHKLGYANGIVNVLIKEGWVSFDHTREFWVSCGLIFSSMQGAQEESFVRGGNNEIIHVREVMERKI